MEWNPARRRWKGEVTDTSRVELKLYWEYNRNQERGRYSVRMMLGFIWQRIMCVRKRPSEAD